MLAHVALGYLKAVDEAAALVRVEEVVHPDPDAANFYCRLLSAFAATARRSSINGARRFDKAPDLAASNAKER
jgi:Tfp pilus assembly protein PilF